MRDQLLMALYGGSAVVCATIGLVFMRYWRDQRDRLFKFFAAAFWCFAVGWMLRIVLATHEYQPYVFMPRLFGFLLIIVAIFDKNRRARAPRDEPGG